MNYSKFTVKISIIILLASAIMAFALEIRAQDITQTNTNSEGAGTYKEELISGNWVLTGVEQKAYNGTNLTKWTGSTNEVGGLHSWQEMLISSTP